MVYRQESMRRQHQQDLRVGADTTLTEEFLKMGVDELSVSAGKVLAVRKVIRETRVS